MFRDLTRRDFVKTAAVGLCAVGTFDLLGLFPEERVFSASNCTVKTKYGTFNGFVDENGVKTWLGIPFAQPPVGKLRWQAPKPLKPSNKSFDAKKLGFAPIQADMKLDEPLIDDDDVKQSENCLTLNIFTRGNGKNKPVMVWIYGGAFVSGYAHEALYSGANFVSAQDVVMVFLNYRLNVFGFMNFASVDSAFSDSGYLGIKDQFAALKWIKENIAEFGGNPENITVFGESAGSMSTMLLTLLPESKNLFQKIISQSGSVSFYNQPEYSAQITEKFMDFCGAKTIGDLMKKSGVELQQLYAKYLQVSDGSNLMDFAPTCDGKFLPKDPVKALKDGGAGEIKFLTGTTSDEWRAFLLGDENFFKIYRKAPGNISYVLRRYKSQTTEEIYKKWLKNRPDTEENYAEFATQIDFRVGQEISSEYQSKFADVYFYLFSEPSPIEMLGSCHAFDIPYTFNVSSEEFTPNQSLVRAMQASWAAFAATGNPDNEFIPHWQKYSAQNRQTMELNSKGCVLHKDLNTENLKSLRYVYEN